MAKEITKIVEEEALSLSPVKSKVIVKEQQKRQTILDKRKKQLDEDLNNNEAYLNSKEYIRALAQYEEIEKQITQNLVNLKKLEGSSFDEAIERRKLEDVYYGSSIDQVPEQTEEEQNPEIATETKETTETLKTEIEQLVKDKKLKNYPGTAIDYLNSIINNNEIFTEREEKDRVEFLKRVKGWIKNPGNIEGVHFGNELVKGAGREKEGMGYYNSDDYSKADLQDNEEIMKEMIRKITNGRTNGWGVNVPELAFLPLILNMSSSLFRSDGDFNDNEDFYLRVSKGRRMWINSEGGVLDLWDDNRLLCPARAVSQVS